MSKELANPFLIVALDLDSFKKAESFVDCLGDSVSFYKVGMQLFFETSGSIISFLQKRNKRIFLDLKLNDIPNTLERAVGALDKYAIDFLTVFCEPASIEKPANLLKQHSSSLKLLNVTKLTSESRKKQDSKWILERAKQSIQFGASGVICSGLETSFLRANGLTNEIIINPGVRFSNEELNDQQVIVTPQQALTAGASHIVMGRSILNAKEPLKMVTKIKNILSGNNIF